MFRENSSDLTMIIGAMYVSVLFVGINNCSTVQPVVAVERAVFYREKAAGMYSALPYAMAQVRDRKFTNKQKINRSFINLKLQTCPNLIKVGYFMQVIVEIPYIFVQTTYYSIIVYAMVSFQWTAAKFLWFFFITFFSFLYFTYYGMMTVSITPNHQAAAIFASAFYALFTLFSGFFIPKPVSSVPLLCINFND
jgi:ABC-type multidrug transport system permease subunit